MFERLTFRDSLGVACYRWELPSRTEVIANEAISRLAAYEDSGLSPEEVQKLKKSDASKEQCIIDQHGEIHRLRGRVETLQTSGARRAACGVAGG